jgi:hypothetical protein
MSLADERAIAEGNRAKEILDAVGPHFASLRNGAMARWRESSSGQTDLREKLFITVNTIDCVEKALQELVMNAHFAAQAEEIWNEPVEAQNALAKQGLTRP